MTVQALPQGRARRLDGSLRLDGRRLRMAPMRLVYRWNYPDSCSESAARLRGSVA